MKLFITLLGCFMTFGSYGQGLWRNFFTTNHAPIVEVVAGSNAAVQATTPNVFTRRFTVNAIPSGAGGSNTVIIALTNVVVVTNAVDSYSIAALTDTNVVRSLATNVAAYQSLIATQNYAATVTNIANALLSTNVPTWSQNATNATFVLTATLTNLVYGSNVVGAVAQATHATNADQATHATNSDIAIFVSTPTLTNGIYASNVVSGGQIINGGVETNQLNNGYLQLTGDKRRTTFDLSSGTNVMGFDGTGAAGTNWVLQQIALLGFYTYFLGPTNSFAITNSGETLARTNVWKGSVEPYATAATQSVGGLAVNAYVRHIISTNSIASLNDGPVDVTSFPFRSSGGGTIIGHYELYWVDVVSNIMHEISVSPSITISAVVPTELATTLIVTNTYTFTNRAYVALALKLDSLGGVPGGATISFAYGGIYPAHLTFPVPLSSATINGSQVIGAVASATNATYVTTSPLTNQIYWTNILSAPPRVVTCVINDGGSVISSGNKGLPVEIPYAASVSAATIMADQIGSIAIACYRTNSTGYPPTSSTPIFTNYLTTTNWSRDTAFAGAISTNIAFRDFIRFNVLTNAATVTNITIQLTLQP